MTNHEGQQIDNYRLIRLLGSGQFGEVYLAEHISSHTRVAIKLLRSLARDDQRDLLRFLNEIRVSRFTHDHIVQVYDFGVEGDTPFIVMQYAPHGTLRQRHPKGTRVPLPTIVSYVKQAADALQYIHDKRFIHRDIKPANLLIGEQNQILLSDFGLVTISHNTLSQSGDELAGTVLYIAPEQMHGRPRPASDQYSLGVVVYEWLCGNAPFQGPMIEVMHKHQTTPPPPLSAKIPTISSDVERVVMRALAKDPKQRFDRIVEFAHALEQASLSSSALLPDGISSEPMTVPVPGLSLPSESTSVKGSTHKVTESRISRRTVVLGGVIAGSVVATGSVAWLILHMHAETQIPRLTPTMTPSPTFQPTPSPTPIPFGMVLTTYKGHTGFVNAMAWSPDSMRIASGSDDGTVQVWKVTDGGLIFAYKGHTSLVEAVAWSPDGKRIASGSFDRTVQVCDAANGSFVYTYMGTSGFVDTVAWSPDGKHIASGSYDGTVQVRNAADGSPVLTYKGHADVVRMLAWSPDSGRIASGSFDGTVQVWDATNGSLVLTYRGHAAHLQTVAWSPDGKHIASGGNDDTVQVWDVTNGSLVFTYPGHSRAVNAVAWSPDSKRIASGGADHTVQVWDALDGGHPSTYTGHSLEVRAVVWSPDGRLIASGSDDTTVQVWGAG